jgi:hypothetical protein
MADAMLQCSTRNPQSEIRNFSMPSFRRRHFLQLAAAGAFAASRPAFAAPPRIKIGQIGRATVMLPARWKRCAVRMSGKWSASLNPMQASAQPRKSLQPIRPEMDD